MLGFTLISVLAVVGSLSWVFVGMMTRLMEVIR
jgi:uncharacterized membrane protein YuzA (DUF378 family)